MSDWISPDLALFAFRNWELPGYGTEEKVDIQSSAFWGTIGDFSTSLDPKCVVLEIQGQTERICVDLPFFSSTTEADFVPSS